ncbi:zinc finger domain-containing protein [Micromonospora lupini]|uniref:zinc finger domain-containing protein n=1 Tax=Micromonospora lupini TaxID=285679 RepID=UPI003F6C24E2
MTMNRVELVQQVACPKCKASAGSPCTGRRGQARKAQHEARWNAAGITMQELTDWHFQHRRQ